MMPIYEVDSSGKVNKNRRMFYPVATNNQGGYRYAVIQDSDGLYIQPDLGAPNTDGYGICCYYRTDIHTKRESGLPNSVRYQGIRAAGGSLVRRLYNGQAINSTGILELEKGYLVKYWTDCDFGVADFGTSTDKIKGGLYKYGSPTFDNRLHRSETTVTGTGWSTGCTDGYHSTGLYTLDAITSSSSMSNVMILGGWSAIVAAYGCYPKGYEVLYRHRDIDGTWEDFKLNGFFSPGVETVEPLLDINGNVLYCNIDGIDYKLWKVTHNFPRAILVQQRYEAQFFPLLMMKYDDEYTTRGFGVTLMAQYFELIYEGKYSPRI